MYDISKGKKLFLGATIILGLFLGTLVTHPEEEEKLDDIRERGPTFRVHLDFNELKKTSRVETEEDLKVIMAFLRLVQKRNLNVGPKRWLGIPSLQNPGDNWLMQEIITELKPDFVIETGTFKGGSSLFYATVLEKINENGKVITVDISPQVEEASKFKIFKERVEVIKGDSVSPEVIKKIAKRVKNHKVLVTLDSLHTKEHVLKELKLYSNFVSLNSYIIVQDTILYKRDLDDGPMGAIKEFLKTNKNFVIDRSREKFFFTNYLSGFLKKVK